MGVPAALFERRTSPEPHPRAHYINNRTMETLRSIPEASQTVARLSPPLDHWRRFVYSTGLPLPRLPRVLASVDHFPGAPSFPADPAATPSPVAHVPQHAFSATLLDRARRMSAAFGSALSLFEGWEVAGVDDHGGGAVVTARRGEEEARVACDWVVACDGAGSRVRKRAGMDMEGEPCIQTLISAHFR